MEFRRHAARAVVAGAGLMLAACAAETPPPQVSAVEPVAFAPPLADWQWSDAGPAVTLATTDIGPPAGNARMASLALVCAAMRYRRSSSPGTFRSPRPSGLTYRFLGQPAHDVSAAARDPRSLAVSDPLVVSRFIDEAADSRQLVVRAGATEATFSTADDSGNLRRFRTACPDGTN